MHIQFLFVIQALKSLNHWLFLPQSRWVRLFLLTGVIFDSQLASSRTIWVQAHVSIITQQIITIIWNKLKKKINLLYWKGGGERKVVDSDLGGRWGGWGNK